LSNIQRNGKQISFCLLVVFYSLDLQLEISEVLILRKLKTES